MKFNFGFAFKVFLSVFVAFWFVTYVGDMFYSYNIKNNKNQECGIDGKTELRASSVPLLVSKIESYNNGLYDKICIDGIIYIERFDIETHHIISFTSYIDKNTMHPVKCNND